MFTPAKIVIEGDYWDCQIYRGRLYLWTFNGEIYVYDWDGIIDSIQIPETEKLALQCSFCNGEYLYNHYFDLFFSNSEIKELLIRQFAHLSNREIHFSTKDIDSFCRGKQKLPTPALPTDTGVYNNNIYSADETGLYKMDAHRRKDRNQVSTKANKLWDCPMLSFKIGNRGNMAISAGNEGLLEYINPDYYDGFGHFESSIEQISKAHSSFSNWAFSSIYSTSFTDSSYLAPFYKSNDFEGHFDRRDTITHVNDNLSSRLGLFVSKDIIDETRIFGSSKGLSWASNEKFYRFDEETSSLTIIRFTQSKLKEGDEVAFTDKRIIQLSEWKGDVISSGVGYFGTIVECENAIIVLNSDNSVITIPGSAVKWRVYPRSIRYENQLHIIKEDCLEIYSLNHDYFVDQKTKNYGMEYWPKVKKINSVFTEQ